MTTNLTPPKRLILTSSSQVVMLVRSSPQLAASIPKLASLLPVQPVLPPEIQADASPTKKPCNCGAKNTMSVEPPRQLVEDALSSLTSEDFSQIKNILNLDQLCYYKRNTELNVLELFCM